MSVYQIVWLEALRNSQNKLVFFFLNLNVIECVFQQPYLLSFYLKGVYIALFVLFGLSNNILLEIIGFNEYEKSIL